MHYFSADHQSETLFQLQVNLEFQTCMFRELLIPILLSQVRFNLKTKLAKQHKNVVHCSSLGKEHSRHFSRRVTVA